MKTTHYLLMLIFLFSTFTHAQIAYRVLNVKQHTEDFKPLMYRSFNDSIGNGYGFVNPVDYSSFVFLKEKPAEEKTKNWKVEKFRYVEIYDKSLIAKIKEILEKRNVQDSLRLNEQSDKATAIDTFKIYTIKKLSKSLLKKDLLFEIVHENDDVRIFWPVNPFLNHLYAIQYKADDIYEAETLWLSTLEQKPFIRTAKKNLEHCPEIVKKIEEGNYFPFKGDEIKEFAKDFGAFCKRN